MNTTIPRHRLLLALLALLTFATAHAQDGLTVGIGAYPFDGVATLHASLPLFETNEVQHAARADVSYAFEGLPALSASYLLRDTTRSMIAPYLGAGLGIAFPQAPARSPTLSGHALVGARVPLTGPLGAFTEAVVAGNALDTSLRVGVGLTYTLGGGN